MRPVRSYSSQRDGGAIVNIASIAAVVPAVPIPAYGTPKSGGRPSPRAPLELAAHKVRVHAICPGFLWTRASEGLAMLLKMSVPENAEREPRDIFLDQCRRGVPHGREQTPGDIGKLPVFLCSDDGASITGLAISVDGGFTLRVGQLL